MEFWNGRCLLVDLKEHKVEDLEVEGLISSVRGGYDAGVEFMKEHSDGEPLVIGTGIYTASFFPSGCMGFVLWKRNGKNFCLPLNWFFPVEFKLTGFDFLVIKHSSPSPVRLWIRDGICDILPAENLMGKDVWETMDFLKDDHGDEKVQALIAGNNSLSQGYWGGFDSNGCGEEFRKKNLKAVCVRGMGSISISEESFKKMLKVPRGKEIELNLSDEMKKLIHRRNACFNCGLNCYPFFMIEDDPKILKESEKKELGFISLDPIYLKHENPKVAMEMLKKGSHPESLKDDEIPSSFLKFAGVEASLVKECLNFGVCPLFFMKVLNGDKSHFNF
jgi:hypothetical protein